MGAVLLETLSGFLKFALLLPEVTSVIGKDFADKISSSEKASLLLLHPKRLEP